MPVANVMRVVLDTNVWVSGLLWRGAPWRIVRLVEDNRVEVYASAAIITELRHVLSYSRLQPRQREIQQTPDDLVAAVVRLIIPVEPQLVVPVIASDPNDDIFLACALAAGARYLVSGDRHLLDLGQWGDIQIVTVNDFLAQHFPEDASQ